jgi:precorrin-2 dehydrogenase/sirohydrochlorin ferrochelatase
MHYPINIDLKNKKCVVIGGGKVAERKAITLREFGADVVVVAPEITPELQNLADNGSVCHITGMYELENLNGAFLVIAATDNREVNTAISSDAQKRGILVNVVDDPEICTYFVPAMVQRGDFIISISTSGKSPTLARRTREQLESQFGPEYGDLAELLGDLRDEVKSRHVDIADRNRAYMRILDSDVPRLLAEGKRDEAYTRARECI